jgi:hypothetical protein
MVALFGETVIVAGAWARTHGEKRTIESATIGR